MTVRAWLEYSADDPRGLTWDREYDAFVDRCLALQIGKEAIGGGMVGRGALLVADGRGYDEAISLLQEHVEFLKICREQEQEEERVRV